MNWKQMTIGKKIGTGFGLVIALLGALVVISFTGVGEIVKDAEEVIDGNKLNGMLAQREVDHLNWVARVNALLTDEKVTTLNVEVDDHKCGFGKWLYGEGRKNAEQLVPSLAPILKQIEKPHYMLHQSAIQIGKLFQPADLNLGSFLREKKTDHLAWMHKIKDVFIIQGLDEVRVQTDPRKCGLGKWMYSEATNQLKMKNPQFAMLWTDLEGPHTKLHESAITINRMVTQGQKDQALAYYLETTTPLAHDCLAKIDRILSWHDKRIDGMQAANSVYAGQTLPALKEVQGLLHDIREHAKGHIMTDEVMLAAAQGTNRNVIIIGTVAIVAGLLLAFFIARGIVSVLAKISGQMDDGAEQVASAAGQVSSSSQSLAEGSSEQAASIEETSSSLEQMSSMTKQNADNAGQADKLMQSTNQVVEQANESMVKLTQSMEEIAAGSQETSKIIKTIDEIAFQTNLLALNAAVEAARAGEAGAGFAVVADEVRNLAMRAAEAAKNTSSMIEDSVKKIEGGSELVTQANEAFGKVSDSATKVGELVAEIAAASNEQSQGIEQVNTAVTEMDKVVQQNAASAEESASASEEMSAQAQAMKGNVKELTILVGKMNKSKSRTFQPIKHAKTTDRPVVNKQPKKWKKREEYQANGMKPEAMIPLEESDFKDF